MFFFIRRPKIILDCFTYLDYVYQHSPIEQAAENIPSWFKTANTVYNQKNFGPTATMKKCPAIVKTMTSGLYMPLWADVRFEISSSRTENNTIKKELKWSFADKKTSISPHPEEQWKMFTQEDKLFHLKIDSVWNFKTKEDIYFYWTQPFYHKQSEYIIVPGIDSYTTSHNTSINGFINLEKDREFIISQGTPIVHIIPLTDKRIELKHHLVSQQEYDNMQVMPFTFLDYYKKLKKPKLKCPFHKK